MNTKPFILTIFGASGDLAKLKLFPALYALAEANQLPKEFYIIGYARTTKTDQEFKKEFTESIKSVHKTNPKILESLAKNVHYVTGQYDNLNDFKNLKAQIKKLTQKPLPHLAYFSVPPVAFQDIIKNLGETKSASEDIRLILEKPFGQDTESATELFHYVARYFHEEEVYLLDHYLGKSGVQSILTLRHNNRLINQMMKGPKIANIQITAAEDIGVENRIGYFDQVGTIKDMFQSHLLQILSLITMSIPITENHESLHREKYSILSALKFIESPKNIVLGQYKSYTSQKGVPKNSTTETFAALQLFIDRESWYKKPIYLRTGKRLNEKHTYVVVELKKFAFQSKDQEPNRLIFELQPEEKISITLVNKRGSSYKYQQITTSESLACEGDDCLPEHANLLRDVLRKKRLHFLSFQEIIASWAITDKIVHFIRKNNLKPEKYADGSPGPSQQNHLTEIDKFSWFDPH